MAAVLDHVAEPVVDLAFALAGEQVPEDYRYLLWRALQPLVPWLEQEPAAGLVGIQLVGTGTPTALLSRRARLTLRVPDRRIGAARQLQGMRIRIGSDDVEIGQAWQRPLQPSATLYAPLVILDSDDEIAFNRKLMDGLSAMGAGCRAILGRRRRLALGARTLSAFPVALHGCNPAQSLLIQASGLGSWRILGCGIFVPHKKIETIE